MRIPVPARIGAYGKVVGGHLQGVSPFKFPYRDRIERII